MVSRQEPRQDNPGGSRFVIRAGVSRFLGAGDDVLWARHSVLRRRALCSVSWALGSALRSETLDSVPAVVGRPVVPCDRGGLGWAGLDWAGLGWAGLCVVPRDSYSSPAASPSGESGHSERRVRPLGTAESPSPAATNSSGPSERNERV